MYYFPSDKFWVGWRKFTICMQAAAANGAFPYPGLFPPLGQFSPFPRPPLFPPILPPSPPSPGSIRKQDLPPHSFPRPLLPLLPPSSSSPPSLRSPTSDLRDSIFQSSQLRAITGQELDIEQDSKVRLTTRHSPRRNHHHHVQARIGWPERYKNVQFSNARAASKTGWSREVHLSSRLIMMLMLMFMVVMMVILVMMVMVVRNEDAKDIKLIFTALPGRWLKVCRSHRLVEASSANICQRNTREGTQWTWFGTVCVSEIQTQGFVSFESKIGFNTTCLVSTGRFPLYAFSFLNKHKNDQLWSCISVLMHTWMYQRQCETGTLKLVLKFLSSTSEKESVKFGSHFSFHQSGKKSRLIAQKKLFLWPTAGIS